MIAYKVVRNIDGKLYSSNECLKTSGIDLTTEYIPGQFIRAYNPKYPSLFTFSNLEDVERFDENYYSDEYEIWEVEIDELVENPKIHYSIIGLLMNRYCEHYSKKCIQDYHILASHKVKLLKKIT